MKFVDLETQQRRIRTDLEQRIGRVLDHGRYLLGPEVEELERRLAARTGARHVVTVGRRAPARLVALMALDVGAGDEVITSPFGSASTVQVIRVLGARPVFCDIEPDTWLIDPRLIEPLITTRTRAIVPVDLYGQCADYEVIGRVARRYRVPVVAGAAQSFGASQRGRSVGTLATLTATSFYPSRPLGAYGEGGAVLTDDSVLADRLRGQRHHDRHAGHRAMQAAFPARLDTLQCAVLLAKLEVFEDELRRRRAVAETYDRLIAGRVGKPVLLPWNDSAWSHYTIDVDHRDEIQRLLRRCGIPTRAYRPHPPYRERAHPLDIGDAICPVAERAAQRALSLPMHPYLDAAAQVRVCDELLRVMATPKAGGRAGSGTAVARARSAGVTPLRSLRS